MIPQTSFKRLVLRGVLRDVYPMVIRLVAVPDFLLLTDFDDLFHALLGWESGAGYAFRLHGQEFNSLRRRTKTKKLSDFRLHRQERFLYTLGFMDQWEWEIRVIDLQDGSESDERPVCLDGRGATPPQYCGGPTGYGSRSHRQHLCVGGGAAGPRAGGPGTSPGQARAYRRVKDNHQPSCSSFLVTSTSAHPTWTSSWPTCGHYPSR